MNPLIIKKIDFDPDFEPLAGLAGKTPVIKHQLLTGLEQEKLILQRAQDEAREIRRRASEVLEQAEREREEERKRGYEEGREEGLGEFSEKVMEAGHAKEKVLREAEPEIVRMVMDIAEKVIGREIKKGAVVDVVRKAIRESVGQKIVVRVNTLDMEVIRGKEAELLAELDKVHSLSVREDETVPLGGCIIETELGTVDARLEVQLAAIRKALGL